MGYGTVADTVGVWDRPVPFLMYWVFSVIVLAPVTFGLGMLFVFHTLVGIANVTTLENMAGASFGCLPMDIKRVGK